MLGRVAPIRKNELPLCILVRKGEGARALANRSQFRLSGPDLLGLSSGFWQRPGGLPVLRAVQEFLEWSGAKP